MLIQKLRVICNLLTLNGAGAQTDDTPLDPTLKLILEALQ